MTCEQALELISAKLDGELSPAEQTALREHLERCPDCRRVETELEQAEAGLCGIQEEPPDTLAPSVMKKIHREREKRAERRSFVLSVAVLGSIAAIFAVLSGLGLVQLPGLGRDRSASTAISGFYGLPAAQTQEKQTAEALAAERGCAVLIVHAGAETPKELEKLDCQTLTDGSRLYETDGATLAAIQKHYAKTWSMALCEPDGSYDSGADAPACILLIAE